MGSLRKKIVVVLDREVELESVGVLAKSLRTSSGMLRSLEDQGILPPATMIDDSGRRWYSKKHISMLQDMSSHGGFAENRDMCWRMYAKIRQRGGI